LKIKKIKYHETGKTNVKINAKKTANK